MAHRINPDSSAHTIERARHLRRKATFPERLLWSVLRGGRLDGCKFRRQQPIGPYVADFFCESKGLVIELDGESHFGRGEYDRRRENYLRQRKLTILRITNDDVIADRFGVAEGILGFMRRKEGFVAEVCEGYVGKTEGAMLQEISPHPNPLPGERGPDLRWSNFWLS